MLRAVPGLTRQPGLQPRKHIHLCFSLALPSLGSPSSSPTTVSKFYLLTGQSDFQRGRGKKLADLEKVGEDQSWEPQSRKPQSWGGGWGGTSPSEAAALCAQPLTAQESLTGPFLSSCHLQTTRHSMENYCPFQPRAGQPSQSLVTESVPSRATGPIIHQDSPASCSHRAGALV